MTGSSVFAPFRVEPASHSDRLKALRPLQTVAISPINCIALISWPDSKPMEVALPVPSYDQLMLPVLRHAAEKTWDMRDLVARIADDLALTQADRDQELPSGGTKLIASRVHWAKTYLKQAGLLEQPKRGKVQISTAGREVLNSKPAKINEQMLRQFPSFRAFLVRTKANGKSNEITYANDQSASPANQGTDKTPEEQLESASGLLNEALRDALLARILEASPASFEKLIIDVLLAMGYGGSRSDAGEQLGRTGDGGVDGVIREDRLGLDRIYLQAKRYKPGNSVGSETVQAFIGALVGRGAQKGVLITTSTFTQSALEVANQTGGLRLVLIDGEALTRLMIQFNVAVRVARTVEIKRIDLDYFEDIETE